MPQPYETPAGWMGDTRRGAAMGRPDGAEPTEPGRKVSLRRVPLNSGGYDPGGAYWGLSRGNPLWFSDLHGGLWFRAPDRDSAKQYIRDLAVKRGEPAPEFFR